MTHVTGPLVWNEGIFTRMRRGPTQLALELSDGSVRHMNYKNWNGTTVTTANKLNSLKPGAAIRIATWRNYDPMKWFCDVEEVRDPLPRFASQLSSKWVVKHSDDGRKFLNNVVRSVECSIVSQRTLKLDPERVARTRYALRFWPKDPFFHESDCSLCCYVEHYRPHDSKQPYASYWNDFDRLSREVQESWHAMDLPAFVPYIEQWVEG